MLSLGSLQQMMEPATSELSPRPTMVFQTHKGMPQTQPQRPSIQQDALTLGQSHRKHTPYPSHANTLPTRPRSLVPGTLNTEGIRQLTHHLRKSARRQPDSSYGGRHLLRSHDARRRAERNEDGPEYNMRTLCPSAQVVQVGGRKMNPERAWPCAPTCQVPAPAGTQDVPLHSLGQKTDKAAEEWGSRPTGRPQASHRSPGS